MLLRRFQPVHDPRLRERDAGGLGNDLRLFLVHGERGGQHARMGVGNLQHLEDALDRAVLAKGAVQRVEGDVGLQFLQHGGDVALNIDARYPIAGIFEAFRT